MSVITVPVPLDELMAAHALARELFEQVNALTSGELQTPQLRQSTFALADRLTRRIGALPRHLPETQQ